MAKKRGRPRKLKKEEIAEDWCFECKDGGELMICDYGQCLKAYHPECVGIADSFLTSDKRWICGWHKCLVCQRSPNYHCYCCDRAVCSRCIGRVEFVLLKGKYGFCNNCLKLALLVEEDVNVDSDGESVDLRDRETYEGLFREYYEIVKEKEGFDKNSVLAAKAQLDKEKSCRINSDSDKCSDEEDEFSEEEDEQLASDDGDLNDGEPYKKGLKKKRCTQQKAKMQRTVKSKKNEFVGWGSKALIDFLQFIGQDTREKLSQYDVTSIISKYVKEHNLIHPVKKKRIVCDVWLQAVFGKKEVNRHRIYSLLDSHFVENEERSEKDELDHDLEDNDTEKVAEKKAEQNKMSSVKYSTAAQSPPEQNKMFSVKYSTAVKSPFAALIPENIKLVYLKRSLVLEIIKQPQPIETKIIGSFVRIKLDPCDYKRSNSHQLVQIAGIKHGSSDNCNSEIFLQVSNMSTDVCLTMLSDDEFSREECDDLREKVKKGLLKKPTIVELEQKAKILHEDITKHRIARELDLLKKLIDRANEKGWRYELFRHLERKKLLQQPSYLSCVLQNIPGVIPEEVELEALAKDESDGNEMQQCSDKTTPPKQNILGVIPEEVELEALAKDESDGNEMQQCSDKTTPPKQNILGVIPEEVELEALAKDESDGNEMQQCSDKTTPPKQNISGVIPVEEELEALDKDKKDCSQMQQWLDETTKVVICKEEDGAAREPSPSKLQ
nr:PREDICTED: zinc finger CCCH domain-containing protein 19-like isoform X2 [Nicotiana tabacum]XP_016497255.1 PREDICTED: zinc finger CCCH domain-containing protein 19-like isoform X2 [Nicotiana tabacum]